MSFTTSDGELFIYENFVPNTFSALLAQPLQPAPFIHDPLLENSGTSRLALANGLEEASAAQGRRRGTPDTLDDILGPDEGAEGDDFVSDDDGAGYLDEINGYGKRVNNHLDPTERYDVKRRAIAQVWQPKLHDSFQPGTTPWRGNRRYLCKLCFCAHNRFL